MIERQMCCADAGRSAPRGRQSRLVETRRRSTLAIAAIAASVSWTACSRTVSNSPSEAQTGAAGEQARGARAGATPASCRDLPTASDLREYLRRAPAEGGDAGGMFSGKMEWAAIVNRGGEICAAAVATDDPAAASPGSQAIAKAKAYTANAYSTDTVPMSTARLYTLSQPGHSLWSIGQPNAFNPECLETPEHSSRTDGKICGGTIAFGGGVALYRGRTRVGGLGVSGDTPCADHEIAKRIRHIAQLDPDKGQFADDISYASVDGASIFTHPLCPNTWLNGKKIGDETAAAR